MRLFSFLLCAAVLALVPGCLFGDEDPPDPLRFLTDGAGVPGVPYEIAIHDGFRDAPPTEIVELRCDGCVVESSAVLDSHVQAVVTRLNPGVATLHAVIRVEGGHQRAGQIDITFLEPTEIRVHCSSDHGTVTCPALHGVFPGARWQYTARAVGDRMLLAGRAAVTIEGDAVTLVAEEGDRRTFEAAQPGTARVRFTYLELERVIDVRVASADEVTAVSLALPTNSRSGPDGDPLEGAEPFPTTLPVASSANGFLPVSTLADGTLALGGPVSIESTNPEIVTVAAPLYPGTMEGWWTMGAGAVRVGSATIELSIGTASASYPIEVVPDPALAGVDAGF